jgi:hypothetical protein
LVKYFILICDSAPPNFPSQENLEDYAGSSKKHLGGDDVGPAPALPKKQCLSIPSPEKVCIYNIIYLSVLLHLLSV